MQDKAMSMFVGISHGAKEDKEDILFFTLRILLFSFSLRLATKEVKEKKEKKEITKPCGATSNFEHQTSNSPIVHRKSYID
jgi:hypothetical protein